MNDDRITLSKDELIDMMLHKCNFCRYRAGRCLCNDGCAEGITEWLDSKFKVNQSEIR